MGKPGRPKSISDDIRQRVIEQRSKNQSIRDIANSVGISVGSVSLILNESTDFKEIDSIDRRLKQISLQQDRLKEESDRLQQIRYDKFIKTGGEVKYAITVDGYFGEAEIFVESLGRKQVLYKGSLYSEEPSSYEMKKVPECYHDDFITVWKIAKIEINKQIEDNKKAFEDSTQRTAEAFNNLFHKINNSSLPEIKRDHAKQIIQTLVKVYHPDNVGNSITIVNNDTEIIKDVLKLKGAFNV